MNYGFHGYYDKLINQLRVKKWVDWCQFMGIIHDGPWWYFPKHIMKIPKHVVVWQAQAKRCISTTACGRRWDIHLKIQDIMKPATCRWNHQSFQFPAPKKETPNSLSHWLSHWNHWHWLQNRVDHLWLDHTWPSSAKRILLPDLVTLW